MRRTLGNELRGRGIEVTACSGERDLEVELSRTPHDLVLLDRLIADNDDGLRRICDAIRASRANSAASILLLTLSTRLDELKRIVDLGADDYLVLPTSDDDFTARLYSWERRIVNRMRAPRPHSTDRGDEILAFADVSPVMLWLAGPDGACTFFNRSYLQYTGRTLDAERGMGWTEGIHPEDYTRCLDTYLRAIEHQQEVKLEYRLRAADGSYRWMLSTGVPRRDAQGRFDGFVGSCVDINESKRSETILHDSEDRLRSLAEKMPVLVVAFDEAGQLIVWNQECERATGISAADATGHAHPTALLAPGVDEPAAVLERWADPHADFRNLEFEIAGADGRPRTIRWSNLSRELRIPGWAAWSVGVDVTEQKHALTERNRLDAAIRRTQKLDSLSELAGGLAHDFNNLLVTILGRIQLARRELIGEPKELLADAEEAANQAAELTRQLLAYSGKGRFLVESICVSSLVRSMEELLSVKVPKTIELAYRIDETARPIEADASQVQQVLVNLIANAAEAVGDAEGRIIIRTGSLHADDAFLERSYFVDPKAPGAGWYTYIQVTDTGCGLERSQLGQIFDPFFSTKFTGRGLGLAAVLGICRSHRGAIRVHSVPGKGTEIMVMFPSGDAIAPEATVVESTEAPTERAEEVDLRGRLVLLVDDEESVRSVAERMLRVSGCGVVTAVDGVEALEIVQQRGSEIDGVVLDLTMPRMDGVETLRALREIDSSLPVLLSSGFSEHEIDRRLSGSGHAPTAFLQKPYTLDALVSMVQQILVCSNRPRNRQSDRATDHS